MSRAGILRFAQNDMTENCHVILSEAKNPSFVPFQAFFGEDELSAFLTISPRIGTIGQTIEREGGEFIS